MKAKWAIGASVLLAGWMASTARADTHAPWPADWNNWSDPALWVTVGNAGNAADMRYNLVERPEGYGAVSYEYNISKYEVTAGQYTAFLNAVAKTDTYGLYNTTMSRTDYGSGIARSGEGTVGDPYAYRADADFINRPVNYVSFWDACRFANWLGNGQGAGSTETGAYTMTSDGITNNTITRNAGATWAVASEDEWYKAAYYKRGSTDAGYYDYPTSSNSVPGRDMAEREATNSGNNANYYGDPYPIDSDKYTTLVGEFENSDSPYGTFDQGGNVSEWNEAVISGSYRGLRGGSFGSLYGDLHATGRSVYLSPSDESYLIGVRVAVVPEPATLSLLALGGLAVIRNRRRRR